HRPAGFRTGEHGTVAREVVSQVEERVRSRIAQDRPSVISADVCVIGAGPAGIVVADGLIRAGARVILVESGGWDADPAADELNEAEADGPILKGYPGYLSEGRHRR